MTLSIADVAWAAGIIDGEGSIFVMKQKRKDRVRDVNYILRVSVQSADKIMAPELKRMFPDGAEFSVQRETRNGWSDTLKWQLNGKKAARFLKELLPYLRVKKEQALVAIEFQASKKHWKQAVEADYLKQAKLCERLREMKVEEKLGDLID